MGVLQRFEQRLESLVNGAFARAFKAEVQPVEIASALQRECDNRAAIVSRERTMVPNHFVVELATTDHERLAEYADALRSELSDVVREHAAEQHYSFVGPVSIDFERDGDLDTGVFHVRSAAESGPTHPAPEPPRPTEQPRAPAQGQAQGQPTPPAQAPERTRGAPYLEVDHVRYPITSALAVIGRGSEADVRIDDPGVSRRHAQLRLQAGAASITDLGSTNGLVVDGQRVREAPLHDGSTIVLGATTVVFRSR